MYCKTLYFSVQSKHDVIIPREESGEGIAGPFMFPGTPSMKELV